MLFLMWGRRRRGDCVWIEVRGEGDKFDSFSFGEVPACGFSAPPRSFYILSECGGQYAAARAGLLEPSGDFSGADFEWKSGQFAAQSPNQAGFFVVDECDSGVFGKNGGEQRCNGFAG